MNNNLPPTNQANGASDIFHREYTFGDVLTRAWTLFRETAGPLARLTLLILLPANAVAVLLGKNLFLYAGNEIPELTGNDYLAVLIMVMATVYGSVAAIIFLWKRLHHEPATLGDAMRQALSRWMPALLTSILLGVAMLALFLLLIIPGIIFSVYWAFALYAVAIHGKFGYDAASYSRALVKGRWWKTLGYALLLMILVSIISEMIASLIGLLGDTAVTAIAAATVSSFLSLFIITGLTVMFINWESTAPAFKE